MIHLRKTILRLAIPMLAGLAVLTWLFYPEDCGDILAGRGVPVPPGDLEPLGLETGGFTAHWLFMALEADHELCERSRQILKADGATITYLGNGPDHCAVVPIEDAEGATGIDPETKTYFKRKLNDSYISWWKTDEAVRGTVHEKQLPNSCGYWVLISEVQKRIYIYWHYS